MVFLTNSITQQHKKMKQKSKIQTGAFKMITFKVSTQLLSDFIGYIIF